MATRRKQLSPGVCVCVCVCVCVRAWRGRGRRARQAGRPRKNFPSTSFYPPPGRGCVERGQGRGNGERDGEREKREGRGGGGEGGSWRVRERKNSVCVTALACLLHSTYETGVGVQAPTNVSQCHP
jgi:hypothetical protein